MIRVRHLVAPIYLFLLLLPHGLFAQELTATPPHPVLHSGTPINLQLTQTISSARAHNGDRLAFQVIDDVTVDGFTVIRAGASAQGTVIAVRGKRPLGIGGKIILRLDSVELTTGETITVAAQKEFKGRSHTIRMAVGMAITAAVYLPATPVLLLSRGRDSTVLKGTQITAYTIRDSLLDAQNLPVAPNQGSELNEMVKLLPPRVMNGEGREGDMLNLIFMAKEEDLQQAFTRAGWLNVEKSKTQIFWHLLLQRKRYTKLPMDRLYVFGRPQDYSFALPDPLSIVARRHHLRIWRTDRVVDGVPLWVAAATHDVGIQFVKRKFRLYHTIDPNVDAEREFIAGNLAETRQVSREQYLTCSDPVFRAQTATGQPYYSDSRMLLLEMDQLIPLSAGATQAPARPQSTSR
jgi:hypothetical protein